MGAPDGPLGSRVLRFWKENWPKKMQQLLMEVDEDKGFAMRRVDKKTFRVVFMFCVRSFKTINSSSYAPK
jgi:hypothetical protein